jgi:hypothetical protein
MNLATFNSRDEALHFKNVTTSDVWVGIRDFDENNQFKLVTDRSNAGSFLSWGPGQPDNIGERCVVNIVEVNYEGFNDADCDREFSFSCELVEATSV